MLGPLVEAPDGSFVGETGDETPRIVRFTLSGPWSEVAAGFAPTMVGDDGTIYARDSSNKEIGAVRADGQMLWSTPLEDANVWGMALGLDGTVYVTVTPGTLVAIDGAGHARFSVKIGTQSVGPPAVDAAGTVLVVADGQLGGVNPDGTILFRFGDADPQVAPYRSAGRPVVRPDGSVGGPAMRRSDARICAFVRGP